MEKNFRIWHTVGDSFEFVHHHWKGWLKITLPPILILLVTIYLIIMILWGDPSITAQLLKGGISSLVGFGSLFILALGALISSLMFIANAYRFANYREGGMKWFEFRFDRYMLRVFLFGFAIHLFLIAIGGLSATIVWLAWTSGLIILAVVLGLLFAAVFYYVSIRLIFVVPFAAIGIEKPIRYSIQISRGRVLKLLGLEVVFGVLAYFISSVIILPFPIIVGLAGQTTQDMPLTFIIFIFLGQLLPAIYVYCLNASAIILVYNKLAK